MANTNSRVFLFLLVILLYSPLHAQTNPMAFETPQTEHVLDIDSIKLWLQTNNSESKQMIITTIFTNLNEKTESDVINELSKNLTVEELQSLYNLLLEATEFEWTDNFADKIWLALSLKVKLEAPVVYNNPRIIFIVASPGEKQFSMMLSDGSIWEVAEHLSGSSRFDLMKIRDLLGQYTSVEQVNENNGSSFQITLWGFPELRFDGYMLANPSSNITFKGKEIYKIGDNIKIPPQ